MDAMPPVFQTFKNNDGPLQSLPTHISEKHGDRYVLWSDIQLAFKDIEPWQFSDSEDLTTLFVVDGDTM